MDSEGDLRDTYAAAIQHGLVDVADADRVLGVVRRPTRWFSAVVDENEPAVAPPTDLLDEFAERREDLKMRGMCDEGAHNAAWEEIGFKRRYLDYLDGSPEATAAARRIRSLVDDGEAVVLVCYENTSKKRCHRTHLREWLADDGSAADGSTADGSAIDETDA
ncbi:DUF488 domain-containing protein [Halegenticoccus soli]|uniref:DUF488 domain-containing protein n=1 Tax=Halegenticoccus soli TaxID=1985678 RepID=UPI000C6CC6E4|nr:DUF488 domain-containing protein [Halegenticoccus soli]